MFIQLEREYKVLIIVNVCVAPAVTVHSDLVERITFDVTQLGDNLVIYRQLTVLLNILHQNVFEFVSAQQELFINYLCLLLWEHRILPVV